MVSLSRMQRKLQPIMIDSTAFKSFLKMGGGPRAGFARLGVTSHQEALIMLAALKTYPVLIVPNKYND